MKYFSKFGIPNIIKPNKMIKKSEAYGDSELIQLWQYGNEHAFDLIHKKYSVQLLAIAIQKTGDQEVAREIIQDVFIVFFKNKDSANKIGSLIAYLYVILKNRILNWHRHNLVHEKYEEYASHTHIEEDNSMQEWIETRELEKILNNEIDKLPTQCRNVFKLSRQQCFTNREIAMHLEISENTVEQHMRKAIRILRAGLLHYNKIIALIFIGGLY